MGQPYSIPIKFKVQKKNTGFISSEQEFKAERLTLPSSNMKDILAIGEERKMSKTK